MPIKTQDDLSKAEDLLRIAMMRGYQEVEEAIRQGLTETVSDGDMPENIRLACDRLLQMKFVEQD